MRVTHDTYGGVSPITRYDIRRRVTYDVPGYGGVLPIIYGGVLPILYVRVFPILYVRVIPMTYVGVLPMIYGGGLPTSMIHGGVLR